MDVWQIVNLTLPFLEVILHTIMNNVEQKKPKFTIIRPLNQSGIHFQEEQESRAIKMIKFIAFYGIIGFYSVFIVVFFYIGLVWSRN